MWRDFPYYIYPVFCYFALCQRIIVVSKVIWLHFSSLKYFLNIDNVYTYFCVLWVYSNIFVTFIYIQRKLFNKFILKAHNYLNLYK